MYETMHHISCFTCRQSPKRNPTAPWSPGTGGERRCNTFYWQPFSSIFLQFLKYGFYLFTGAVIPPGSRQPVSCQHPLPSRHLVLSIYFPFSQFLQEVTFFHISSKQAPLLPPSQSHPALGPFSLPSSPPWLVFFICHFLSIASLVFFHF